MKTLSKHIIAVICGMILIVTVVKAEVDYRQLGEDIEVMARIIDKTLEEKYPDEYKAFKPLSWSGAWQGCQGLYLKDYGVIFVTKINLPMSEALVKVEKVGNDDLWEATKKEIRGDEPNKYSTTTFVRTYQSVAKPKKSGYDPVRLEQLKLDLLDVLGKYGSNISLAPQDKVIMAIQDTPGSMGDGMLIITDSEDKAPKTVAISSNKPLVISGGATEAVTPTSITDKTVAKLSSDKPLVVSSGSTEATHTTEKADDKPKEIFVYENKMIIKDGKSIQSVEAGNKSNSKPFIYSRIPGRRTTLVIKAIKEDIDSYKNGKLDMDSFMKKAEITQY